MAKTLRRLTAVICPGTVKDLSEVEKAMDKWEENIKKLAWEENIKKLAKEHKEELSPFMKVAIFTNFMPDTVKDYIYANIAIMLWVSLKRFYLFFIWVYKKCKYHGWG